VRPLMPGDSLARAAELVRTSPGGTAPVQEDGQIIGVVCAGALADWVSERGIQNAGMGGVGDVMQPAPAGVRHDLTIPDQISQRLLDRVLWKSVRGARAKVPPPGPGAQAEAGDG